MRSALRGVRLGGGRGRNRGWLAPGEGWTMAAGGAIVLAVLSGFWALATRTSPDTWVPVLVLVGGLVLGLPICVLLSRAPRDVRLRRVLLLGLALKLVSSFFRYYVNEVTYGGEADSGQYHLAGQVFVENLQDGRVSIDGSALDGLSDETRVVGYVTGVLYTVVGPTYMGGFLVFSFLSWLGLVGFFQAFRVAYPNAPPYLAAKLLFLLPSMLYWPSSIGKDALMVLALGLVAYGAARLFSGVHRWRGVMALVPASVAILQIRPHLLLVALVGLAASLVARNAAGTKAFAGAATRALVLVLLVPLLILGLSRMDQLFGTTDGGGLQVSSALERTSAQTSIGGSAFETRPVSNPLDLPVSIVSVIYRPFLFEARGVVLVSALEGTLLLVMSVASGRWLWRIGPAMYRHQFAAFCGGYVLAFVFAFSNVGNAGILARQRVQMFPFLMLLALAAREHHRVHVESPSPDAALAEPVPSALVSV